MIYDERLKSIASEFGAEMSQSAFPLSIVFDDEPKATTFGLTKREFFAALALQGHIAHNDWVNAAAAAAQSVLYADALLAELERTK